MYNGKKERMFIDMDGTLAEFHPVDELETLYEQGYFINLKPHENVVNGIKHFMEKYPNVETYILSSYLPESKYALNEKNEWLDKYLPEIDQNHRIFVPCGQSKKDYVGELSKSDFLLDDYTVNLNEWEGGTAIKLSNAINGTKGTWKGDKISFDLKPEVFSGRLHRIVWGTVFVLNEKAHNVENGIEAVKEYTKIKEEVENERHNAWGNYSRNKGLSGGTGNVELTDGRRTNIRRNSFTTIGAVQKRYGKSTEVFRADERVTSISDIAQKYRLGGMRGVESGYVIYIKDNKIVDFESVTNGNPQFVKWIYPDDKPFGQHISEKMRHLDTDAFFVLHNHPTGSAKPSVNDILYTKVSMAGLDGFGGHIVAGDNEYSFISAEGEYEIYQYDDKDLIKSYDAQRETIGKAHSMINSSVAKVTDLVYFAEEILEECDADESILAYVDTLSNVSKIQKVDANAIDALDFKNKLVDEIKEISAYKAYLITSDEKTHNSVKDAVREGYLADSLYCKNEKCHSLRAAGLRANGNMYLGESLDSPKMQYATTDCDVEYVKTDSGIYFILDTKENEENREYKDYLLYNARENDFEIISGYNKDTFMYSDRQIYNSTLSGGALVWAAEDFIKDIPVPELAKTKQEELLIESEINETNQINLNKEKYKELEREAELE